MPLPHAELEKYLEQLESLLEGSPDGQDAALGEIFHRLEAFVETGDEETAEVTVRLLGTAVGGQKAWQTPYRESGILEFVLAQLLDTSSTPDLNKQYLRVIGNSVADNDTNRELVSRDLAKLITCISSEDLKTIALIVLFNLCNDFDPAKATSASLRLDKVIAEKLFMVDLPEAALDYAVDLLTWTTENLTTAQFKDTDSLKTFRHILKVALQYDEDHYHEYVAILAHYLQDPDFQHIVATPEMLDNLISLVLDFEDRVSPEECEATFKALSIANKDDAASAPEGTSVILLTQLINSVSAVSATDTFSQTFKTTSPVIERIRVKLHTSSESPSTICMCVMLGNLAMSDAACIEMVKIMKLHTSLLSILSSSQYSALLYAAAGFMRHLTFPEVNRSTLADTGLLETCIRLLKLTDPSVRGEAAAMLGKLVTNSFHNIEKAVYDRYGSSTIGNAAGLTILEHIVEQALAPSAPLPSTTMKNPMIELGRTIVAMLRHLGRPNMEKDVDAVREEMLKIPLLARPVARLIRQRFYADARAEGLLGLGLISQSPEGALRVKEELEDDSGLLGAIREFANGNDGGTEQQSSAAGRDYQNAIVLLQALQNNAGNAMDATLKGQVASLQGELGKLMV